MPALRRSGALAGRRNRVRPSPRAAAVVASTVAAAAAAATEAAAPAAAVAGSMAVAAPWLLPRVEGGTRRRPVTATPRVSPSADAFRASLHPFVPHILLTSDGV